jgi:hypothetical protein
MKTLVLLFLMASVGVSGQYKKVDSWIAPDGIEVKSGDTFTMGAASGMNDQYLYVHSKPSVLLNELVHFKAGMDGREFQIKEVMVAKNAEDQGYFLFKLHAAKFMVRANMALKSGEIIMN